MATTPDMPVWERRFRAPLVTFPSWARDAPHHLVFASNETGAYQLYAWDRTTGTRRRFTDIDIGVTHGFPTLDGSGVIWFDDRTGDEVGQWKTQPFAGGDVRPLVDGVPDAWSGGIALGDGVVVVGTADDAGYSVYRSLDGREAELVHRHVEVVEVADLSRDATLVCLAHAEHGDSAHLALRVLDVRSGDVVADEWDGEGLGLVPGPWSPVPGDERLAIVTERAGAERPALWNPRTGERVDAGLPELPGDVSVADWWPDASALLLVHTHEGRDHLLRAEVDGLTIGAVSRIDHPVGSIGAAAVRPDGTVWYDHASGASAPSVRDDSGAVVVAPEAPAPPDGYPYRSWHFTNPHGEQVHGFVVEPPGPGPHPTVLLIHGGPHWHWSDTWRPEVPAWVDHGFAVAMVNYRGSTGYGTSWRDAIIGNPGFPELEDEIAGLDALVASGVTDPGRVVVSGGSWGGYLTLLALGRHPERWSAAIAVVPVADYPVAFEDEAPGLKAFDRVLFGGTPADRPDLYRERSPLTYVEQVRAPVLVIAGDNDSRCPIRQVENYLGRLDELDLEHQVHRFDAGHGSLVIEERVTQMGLELDFVLDRVKAG